MPQWRERASEGARREATAAATREETDDGGRENRKGRKKRYNYGDNGNP